MIVSSHDVRFYIKQKKHLEIISINGCANLCPNAG